MAFDWMDTPRIPSKRAFEDMYRDELIDQARLLKRLGYNKEQALARLTSNVEWEFDTDVPRGELPAFHKRLGNWVAEVYGSAAR